MRGYRDLAADLRRRIESGEFPPGSVLPKITDLMEAHGLARQTVRAAIAELTNEGLVVPIKKRGTVVRDRSPIRIPLSRYSGVLQPGGTRGPWESACAAQGLDGRMVMTGVNRAPANDELADLLEVPVGTELVGRRRQATIEEDVVQVQQAWYPADLADEAGLAGNGKVNGGIYGALAGAGVTPTTISEQVTSRMPTAEEAAQLRIGGSVPVLALQRVTRAQDRRVLEVLFAVAPADRLKLVYDDVPLRGSLP
ncbi:GntR family transcriptional regulator [Streptomyces sp. NPDC001380]|uniref:GntR family transcriptional regulator n=1 Tax=Streptomyces sp. NPDC001380 TaxID=3364566 RepID=UPI0036A0B1CA